MIVYNVGRRWFEMKNDAETYRRAEGLPAGATFKLVVEERASLAALLNGLCGVAAPQEAPPEEQIPVVREMIQRNQVRDDIPDYVPDFLRREWAAKWAREEKQS